MTRRVDVPSGIPVMRGILVGFALAVIAGGPAFAVDTAVRADAPAIGKSASAHRSGAKHRVAPRWDAALSTPKPLQAESVKPVPAATPLRSPTPSGPSWTGFHVGVGAGGGR